MRLVFREARLVALCLAALAGFTGAAAAQADPSGSWRTWHTEHFRIHAQAHLGADARRVAREAERAYALLTTELEPPQGSIDLVVADNADIPNGFATPFPSNRVTLFLTPPLGTASLDDYDDWVRLVVTHELTHVFHLGRADGVWRVLQMVFGRAPFAFPNTYQPSWVKEGVATYYESRYTNAGRVRSGFHRQLLAAAHLSGRWPAPGDLSLVSLRWPAGFGPYAWGAEFFAQEAHLRGDSIIPEFMRRTSRRLWPVAVSGSLEGAGGRSVGDGWRALRARASADSGQPHRVVVRGLRVPPQPRVAPNGRRIAYVASRSESVEHIEIRSVPGDTILLSHVVNGGPSITWVGDSVVIAQLDLISPVTIRKDLYAWSDEGFRRLTHGARLDHPFATGDGRVGAVDLRARASRLVVADGKVSHEWPAPPADGWSRIVVSPNGEWVAGQRHWSGRWDLVVWPTGRPASLRRITDDRALDEDPAWSPEGELFFASDRSGIFQVYRADLETAAIERVTDDPRGARQPAPLGDAELVYVTLLEDGFALVRARARAAPADTATSEEPPAGEPISSISFRETGYRPWAGLRPHYWIPVARHEGETGVFVGALTTGSDVIGRTRYSASAAGNVTGGTLRPELVMAVAHSRWQRWSLDGTVRQTWSGAVGRLTSGGTIDLTERERRAELGLTHAWRRWRSSLAVRIAGEMEETTFFDPASDARLSIGTPVAAGGVLAIRAARVERPPLAISPENGAVLRGTLRHRWALDGSGTGDERLGSVSTYVGLPLPGFAHWVLAMQASAGSSDGAAAGLFGVGGVSSDAFEIVPGFAVGVGRRSFPLRGYPRASGFTRVGSGVVELRIPLFLLSKGVWGLPLLVDRVSVTMFGEVGGGWTVGDDASPTEFRDVGAELVLDLGVSYDVPLRLRLGGAIPLTEGLGVSRGELQFYLAFGPSF